MAGNYPSIPEPNNNPATQAEVLRALKEIAEILTGLRGSKRDAAVTFQDLVNLGVIPQSKVPK